MLEILRARATGPDPDGSVLVAFVNFDPAPEDTRGSYADRDRWSRNSDDAVGLYIDTFGDRRNAYYLMIWDRSNLETLSRGTQMGVRLAGTRQTSADAFGRINRESFAGIPFDLPEAGITLSTSLFPWLQTRGQAIDFRLVERMS